MKTRNCSGSGVQPPTADNSSNQSKRFFWYAAHPEIDCSTRAQSDLSIPHLQPSGTGSTACCAPQQHNWSAVILCRLGGLSSLQNAFHRWSVLCNVSSMIPAQQTWCLWNKYFEHNGELPPPPPHHRGNANYIQNQLILVHWKQWAFKSDRTMHTLYFHDSCLRASKE